jgi:hypothetical protein
MSHANASRRRIWLPGANWPRIWSLHPGCSTRRTARIRTGSDELSARRKPGSASKRTPGSGALTTPSAAMSNHSVSQSSPAQSCNHSTRPIAGGTRLNGWTSELARCITIPAVSHPTAHTSFAKSPPVACQRGTRIPADRYSRSTALSWLQKVAARAGRGEPVRAAVRGFSRDPKSRDQGERRKPRENLVRKGARIAANCTLGSMVSRHPLVCPARLLPHANPEIWRDLRRRPCQIAGDLRASRTPLRSRQRYRLVSLASRGSSMPTQHANPACRLRDSIDADPG